MEPKPTSLEQPTEAVRSVDAQLLRTLADGRSCGVSDLIEQIGVTATAIRQRLERLLAAGLVERDKLVTGRGRPSFEYRVTEKGLRYAGADPADLAEAMWHEIFELPDEGLRKRLLAAIARRLGQGLARETATASLPLSARASGSTERSADNSPTDSRRSGAAAEAMAATDADAPANTNTAASGLEPRLGLTVPAGIEAKLRQIGESLAKRRIATQIGSSTDAAHGLPVLDLQYCPYPNLRDATPDRSMCELERRMLSEALGGPVELSTCVLDGDPVCRFVPQASA